MSTAAELLDEVADAGLSVSLNERKNLDVGPRERLTPEIRQRLIAAKPALVAHLLSRRAELMKKAAEELSRHPEQRRAVVLDPDDSRGRTYSAGIAVRLDDGAIVSALMTGIATSDPFLLAASMQRACEGEVH